MSSISNLPPLIMERVIKYARGRVIPGTNRFARVSRQWREACDSDSEEAEPLQLYLDLRHMEAADFAKAAGWLAMHGQHVQVLAFGGSLEHSPVLVWSAAAAAALCNLRRLEVIQEGSLEQVAPVLGQLPMLDHLAANVSLREASYGGPCGYEGAFMNGMGDIWLDLPDMQQLSPQLTQLELKINHATNLLVLMDARLPQLLPVRLQHLTLTGTDCNGTDTLVDATSLVHLTALQRFTARCVELVSEDETLEPLLQAIPQLRLQCVLTDTSGGEIVDPPASRTIDFTTRFEGLYPETVRHMLHLTRLVVTGNASDWFYAGHGGTGMHTLADELAGQVPLQELVLTGGWGRGGESLLQQVAHMPTLRSLQLAGFIRCPAGLGPGLAQCTQLTCLGYLLKGTPDEPCPAVPQQLTGLRCLRVRGEMLVQDGGSWLSVFTQLTRLEVTLTGASLQGLPVLVFGQQQQRPRSVVAAQGYLEQVQQWPASLQQVMFWVEQPLISPGFLPSCWEYEPPSLDGKQLSVWVEAQDGAATNWLRPFSPCPHLPGVWELQGRAQ